MRHLLLIAAAALLATPALAAPAADIAAAKAILVEAVAVPTVKGRPGQNLRLAALTRDRLIAAGFAPADVTVTALGETAMLHAIYRGTGKRRPIAVAGHMDVVEADPRDWTRDPFVPVEEKGYLFGRGVYDNKFDNAAIVATLVRLKRENFRPRRDIHLFLSGDEETDARTAPEQAKAALAAGVEFALNGDGGGGELDTAGRPVGYSLQGAEKTYADFKLDVTSPGGHSSTPAPDNAIARLAAATVRLKAHRFPAEANELTRATLAALGAKRTDPLGAAMRAFAADPSDAKAAATLATEPATVGRIGTTCEPTMITGGHAPNALPQRATLVVNCRIFPGTSIEAVRATLERVVADPAVAFTTAYAGRTAPASPMRADVLAAVGRAIAPHAPGVAVVPGQTSGATDGVFYRALGIPVYGVSGLFIRNEDEFAHGLDERIPVAAIGPALDHWHTLLTELAR